MLRAWLQRLIEGENCTLQQLNFIFCSDAYLHGLNVQYLQHDTLTDVITFPYAAPPEIEGDVFISVERVRDNARELGLPFEEELHRVMAHGTLHLCGYGDKTPAEVAQMREKEEAALLLLQQLREGGEGADQQ
ncbi:MAG: rRNA maturation RNase YbeY [Bacteroidetes bacterium]|nr:MAG: rRNA maturation RNase YbeY [Bacteroidota bacterium]